MTRVRPTLAASAIALTLVLSACAPSGTPAAHPSTTADHRSALQLADDTATSCMLGSWTLDDQDYAEQNRQWLTDKGLPISVFLTSGTATLTITKGHLTFHNATTTSAVVGGHSYTHGMDRSGETDWTWSPDDERSLVMTAFAWDSTDAATGDPITVGTIFDPAPGATLEVTCDGPLLELQGAQEDITGRFNRA